ncbi:50S ribosomal protein L18 [Spiroplasma endosymbiont of Anurida maritima]|uniref:50S ribosomal protein L18 n=1 Tax=Spiroplasma endosymbiont of Anurida maritima TaxID=2967972 RepID=UPI0036D25E42
MKQSRNYIRKIRHARVRNKISGTAERPRLCVFKSNGNFYAQIINDVEGVTLLASSTLKMTDLKSTGNVEAAAKVGEDIAKKAISKKIKNVVFDRGGYLYHGKVKAFADSARKAGLEF